MGLKWLEHNNINSITFVTRLVCCVSVSYIIMLLSWSEQAVTREIQWWIWKMLLHSITKMFTKKVFIWIFDWTVLRKFYFVLPLSWHTGMPNKANLQIHHNLLCLCKLYDTSVWWTWSKIMLCLFTLLQIFTLLFQIALGASVCCRVMFDPSCLVALWHSHLEESFWQPISL